MKESINNHSNPHSRLPPPILGHGPISALAPMQDVTTLEFMTVVHQYGPPDYFFTEFFRVHETSTLEKHILASITENPTNRPVFAQLIGEDLVHLKRTALELKKFPIAGVDLNMGCPAPKVYKKNVGGGLLKDPKKVDAILGTLRDSIDGLFTVKMRIGFEDDRNFEEILSLINKHEINLLSVHGRTVKEMYRSEVHYDHIQQAVQAVKCPVLANGNVTSPDKAQWTLNFTQAHGVMIGRSAIRNPWIFRQIREHLNNQPVFKPTFADVYDYVERLYSAITAPNLPELNQVARMKKFLNFVGQGVDPEGLFLHAMRRTRTRDELFATCKTFLLDNDHHQLPFAIEPHRGLIARPNCETPECSA